MPSSLYRGGLILARANRSAALACCRRWCSSDALVEVKPGEVGLVSGTPEEHLRRRVIIYSPARTATQQGSGKVGRWKLIFCLHKSGKIHLMAWTSTGDPYANVGEAGLSFDSEEEVAYTSSEDISSPSHMLTTSSGRAQQRARMINVVHATIQRSYILML